MNKPLFKFYRHEGNKVIIIPTADGLTYFDNNKNIASFKSDKGQINHFRKGMEKVSTAEVLTFEIEFDANILHIECKQNIPMNKVQFRVYTSGQVNYYMKLPFSLSQPRFQEVVT